MNLPRLAILVHGGPNSIEAVRARGLAADWPEDRLRRLFRGQSRAEAAAEWTRQLDEFRPEVVYVLNTALPGAALAPRWCRRRSVPYLLDTGDVIYEMARRSGVTPRWKLPFLWHFERLAQRRARTIVVRGTKHREHLLRRGHRSVEVIRDGYVPAPHVSEADVAALKRRLGLKGFFVAGVMGSLVWSPRLKICYGWDLIEALAQLRDLSVRALIIGDGNGWDWLKARAERFGVRDRVVFTGRIPYPEVPAHLRVMDVALSTQTNNLPGQVRTTGKLPEYMATGRYILASRVGDAEVLLPPPMLVDYAGEVDAAYPGRLADRLRRLATHPADLALRETLPAVAERECSYPVLARRFREVIAAATALP
jgi:glycosyltransferase involved in cell wall biosynthesis